MEKPDQAAVQIREMSPADAGTLVALAKELGYPEAAANIASRLDWLVRSEEDVVLIGETGRRAVVAGWVHVCLRVLVETEVFAEIGGLVVTEGHRRRHVGTTLMAAAENWAINQGVGVMRIRSNTRRRGAHAFYGRLGYEPVKLQQVLTKTLSQNTAWPRWNFEMGSKNIKGSG